MPLLAAGVYQYNTTEAYDSISAALGAGFTAIDTALDYWNQEGVGRAVREFGRDKVFVETKIPGCGNPVENTTRNPFTCYKDAKANLATDLEKLGLDQVDLVILHFPPFPSFVARSCTDLTGCCAMAREQWKAMEEFYYEGKAKAIGVSNYCPSVFECLNSSTTTTFPMVNQVEFHVGSGANHAMQALQAYHTAHGVVTQGYSTLGNTPWTHHASADILHGNLTTSIAKKHNVSTVQVALKWVVQHDVAAVTKSSNPAHLASDVDLWSWDLDAQDMAELDDHVSADSPSYPSFACSH
eukprot:CAMPEP_0174695220 /NCGR_PEP_ID=MMETSP1094-20130205/1652_1 /TAXON_ID=156173 /ORGANISM="Chrysochromulina brevifilum, Strain UTEX LB 985" /LENGTH=296 /DNA_ID=CAMNT_0015891669 /DNA_START=100 /DNA_END=990 /DNA_ORIENTATION=+